MSFSRRVGAMRRPWLMVAVLVSAIALMLGMTTALSSNKAHAEGSRDTLRPGCTWDAAAYWVQKCTVHSNAMNKDIPVQIQAANGNGNAGLYILGGFAGPTNSSGWIDWAHAQNVFVDDNITKVFPLGGKASFYTDWEKPSTSADGTQTYKWDTFLSSELPAYLQANFGVSPTNNAVAGMSMGGTGAMNLAAHHPNQFRQVSSFSGYLATSNPIMRMGIAGAMLGNGGYRIDQMWTGDRIRQNDPTKNAAAYRNTDVYISAATGWWNPQDDFFANPVYSVSVMGMEAVSRVTTTQFEGALRAQGINPTIDYPLAGVHNWTNWRKELIKVRPRILQATQSAAGQGVPEGDEPLTGDPGSRSATVPGVRGEDVSPAAQNDAAATGGDVQRAVDNSHQGQ